MSPQNSSILVVVIQFIGNLLFLTIADRFNRRVKSIEEYILVFIILCMSLNYFLQTILICSSILTATAYFGFGVYCSFWMNIEYLQWMPPFFVSSILFCSCMGILPIPNVITSEIYPKKVFFLNKISFICCKMLCYRIYLFYSRFDQLVWHSSYQ